MKPSFVFAISVAILVAACDKKPDETKPLPSPSAAAAPASAAPDMELADDDVPVPEDFLEEATKEIDDKNYKTQIDSIEKEIEARTD